MTRDKRFLESLVPPRVRSEGFEIEWKSSARFNLRTNSIDKSLAEPIIKTITAYINSRRPSGKILVGYNEREKEFIGIEKDDCNNDDGSVDFDKWGRYITDLLIARSGPNAVDYVEINFYSYSKGITCAVISVERSQDELFEYKKDNKVELYYRGQYQNVLLQGINEIQDYKKQRNQGRNFKGGWATNTVDANVDKNVLSGEWKDKGMVREALSDEIPAKGGLYMYTIETNENRVELAKPFSELMTIAYIGKAKKSIKQRYKDHWKEEEFVSCRSLYDTKFKFYYLEVEDEYQMGEWEKELTKFYGPSINKKIG